MLVSTYNNRAFEDVLSIMLKDSDPRRQSFERVQNISQIKNDENGQIVGFNIFQASNMIAGLENGPVRLDKEAVDKLNQAIRQAGFDYSLEEDPGPKFVVGNVQEIKDHEDSDHLSITQTEVDGGQVLQIVCGAPNVDRGQKVVVAKPGAVMPDGLIIWPGKLRGVESNGMICSAKELGLEAKGERGILVLEDTYQVGAEFEPVK